MSQDYRETNREPRRISHGSSESFIAQLGDSVRKNPLPAALIGMGLMWLFTGDKFRAQAGQAARRVGVDRLPDLASDALTSGRSAVKASYDTAADGVTAAAARVADNVQSIGGRLGETVSSANDRIHQTGDATMQRAAEAATSLANIEFYDTAKASLTDLFERQPLFLGAVGLAIGAGIAASFPSTDFETELLGEASDEFKQQAKQLAEGQIGHAGAVASAVVNSLTEEARVQGLTIDGLKAAANDTGDKIRKVVETATDSVKGRLN